MNKGKIIFHKEDYDSKIMYCGLKYEFFDQSNYKIVGRLKNVASIANTKKFNKLKYIFIDFNKNIIKKILIEK